MGLQHDAGEKGLSLGKPSIFGAIHKGGYSHWPTQGWGNGVFGGEFKGKNGGK